MPIVYQNLSTGYINPSSNLEIWLTFNFFIINSAESMRMLWALLNQLFTASVSTVSIMLSCSWCLIIEQILMTSTTASYSANLTKVLCIRWSDWLSRGRRSILSGCVGSRLAEVIGKVLVISLWAHVFVYEGVPWLTGSSMKGASNILSHWPEYVWNCHTGSSRFLSFVLFWEGGASTTKGCISSGAASSNVEIPSIDLIGGGKLCR
jgi:hypothetical protein